MSKVEVYDMGEMTHIRYDWGRDGKRLVGYDDYAAAIEALTEVTDRLKSSAGYSKDSDETLARWAENGDHDAAAILAARAVLERAP